MSFGGRAPPGPAGGAYSAPQTPIAALKLFAPSAPRVTPSAFGDERFGSSFFPLCRLKMSWSTNGLKLDLHFTHPP